MFPISPALADLPFGQRIDFSSATLASNNILLEFSYTVSFLLYLLLLLYFDSGNWLKFSTHSIDTEFHLK